ncbi:MAG TPA: hypothetical protein VJO99_12345 [Burkholderiaceae bacterium]|nr:hypothetical protein [Burkholderiaceae bacterium]
MPYVRRNAMGEIESIHKAAAPDAMEYLDPSDGEVRRFVTLVEQTERFGALDAEVIRVLEDVVDVIMAKGLVEISELPPEAQLKLLMRREQRTRDGETSRQKFAASGFVEIIDDSAFGQLDAPLP